MAGEPRDASPNLKGSSVPLRYYREYRTDMTEPITKQVQGKPQTVLFPVMEKKYFQEEDVRTFSLDTYSMNLPIEEGNITILHNYMLDYWSHFLGAEGIALYLHLRRFCYTKDYCWPKLDTLAFRLNKAPNTVRKYLDLLEFYGFIYRFYVENEAKKKAKETPIYKVKKQFPFLPKSLIDELPPPLREEHETFVITLAQKHRGLTIELDEKLMYQEVYEQLEANAEPDLSVVEGARQQMLHLQTLRQKQSPIDQSTWEKVLQSFLNETNSKRLSKPSFETWFAKSLAVFEGDTVTLYFPNEFNRDWVEKTYRDFILDHLLPIRPVENIQFRTYWDPNTPS